jgi:hypothetical protein
MIYLFKKKNQSLKAQLLNAAIVPPLDDPSGSLKKKVPSDGWGER